MNSLTAEDVHINLSAPCCRPIISMTTWDQPSLKLLYYSSPPPKPCNCFAKSVSEPVDSPNLRNEPVRDPLVLCSLPCVGPVKAKGTHGRILTRNDTISASV